jgi:hypothetical protein
MNAAKILAYLRMAQQPDGSFNGFASPSRQPFSQRRRQETIFPTILIADCLQAVTGTDDICRPAVAYLEQQVSKQGSWNYWDTQSASRLQEPYPDDLDDTACALAAITRADPAWIDGARLGQFARLLVASEQQPGGPYNTWLIDTKQAPQWQQVDVAVNANVAYALSLHDVQLQQLIIFIERAIAINDYTSSYYVGELPVLYFISRWYKGKLLAILRQKLMSLTPTNALEQALLLSAACHLQVSHAQLQGMAQVLESQLRGDHWPAAAFYIDPVYNGRQYYGGSALLTTAFALEALATYAGIPMVRGEVKESPNIPDLLPYVRRDAAHIGDSAMKRRYLQLAERVLHDKSSQEITGMAALVSQSGGWQLTEEAARQLNLASLYGWMAYTLYDDVLDGQAPLAHLPTATIALRRSLYYFLQAAPVAAAHTLSVFDTMDSANAWELRRARATVHGPDLRLSRLPDYGSYQQLAQRSLGHSLVAVAVLTDQYHDSNHHIVVCFKTFFEQFLIARQLNDDAHDWEEDLQAGHLSAVVTLLLRSVYTMPHTLRVADDLAMLRRQFWHTTIDEVAVLIRSHLQQARQALEQCVPDLDIAPFTGWLDTIEASVASALAGRRQALQFMQAYGSV